MKKFLKFLLRFVLFFAVIGAGVAIAQQLIASAPVPERKPTELQRTPVEVVAVQSGATRVSVSGMGTVVPARRVELFAEVGGRVRAQFDGLREGAYVARGTRLVRVDARDYKYAVDTARASVAQARARLEDERNRKEVAERDWELLGKSLGSIDAGSAPPSDPAMPAPDSEEPDFKAGDMARRVPQIQSAEANLRSVRSQLAQAELQVGRTNLVAPFDAVVTRKNVEPGQLVGPTTSLATLVGTKEFYIKVAVPVGSLGSIAIPGTNTSAPTGARARVLQQAGDEVVERSGHVMFLLGELAQEGRMAQLVVAVDDPFELKLPPEQRKLPLLLGSYVRVEIEGEELADVVELPRSALRENDTVWLVDDEQQLEIRPITVRWRAREHVFINEGLRPGDRVVTSRLAVPLNKMPVRVVEAAAKEDTAAGQVADAADTLEPPARPTPLSPPEPESSTSPAPTPAPAAKGKKTKSKKTKGKKTKKGA